ncbi:MAG: DUF4838 domain-containing protein [Lentisphaerae bacterium]|nr:DUF4838 domain-containing protein [Lentisphaerota bacterium]
MSIVKIIQSNLTAAETNFINAELALVLQAAAKHNIQFIETGLILHSNASSPLLPDERSFAEYAEDFRKAQSYTIENCDGKILISGGGYPGVLYGFYSWLRQTTGVQWNNVNDDEISFGPIVPESAASMPKVAFRGMNGLYPDTERPFFIKMLRWMARNQWNCTMIHVWRWEGAENCEELIELAHLCAVELNIGGHAMNNFIAESLFETHPEYFGMRYGERRLSSKISMPDMPNKFSQGPLQPCFSNPEAVNYIAKNIAEYIGKHPEIKVFALWPHDGVNNWCQCPECKKITPFDQVRRLADAVLKLSPRPVYLELLAYCSLLTLPQEMADLSRTYTIFCPYLRHYHHRFYDSGLEPVKNGLGKNYPEADPVCPVDDREYGPLWNDWIKAMRSRNSSANIFAYYQLLFTDYKEGIDRSRYLRYPAPELVADELRRFIADGMQVYYDCSCPYPAFWPDGRLYSFHSRVLWDPECDINQLISAQSAVMLGVAAGLIDRITSDLDHGVRDFSKKLLDEFDALNLQLPEKNIARLRLWIEYTVLASGAETARRRQDYHLQYELEQKIIQLFNDNTALLDGAAAADRLAKFAQNCCKHALDSNVPA